MAKATEFWMSRQEILQALNEWRVGEGLWRVERKGDSGRAFPVWGKSEAETRLRARSLLGETHEIGVMLLLAGDVAFRVACIFQRVLETRGRVLEGAVLATFIWETQGPAKS